MDDRFHRLDSLLGRLDALLASTASSLAPKRRPAVDRFRIDSDALRFHLANLDKATAPIITVIGGTGTGKSTLVNRLLSRRFSAASFRRTYTSGSVAVVSAGTTLPAGWMGMDHVKVPAADLPARGQAGSLLVVENETASSPPLPTLVDTPDLDGDQPMHHAQADRAFRWAKAVLFLVSPEKYQMTEVRPYYRLAVRYALPTLFVMNKCEEAEVLEDYRRQLREFTESNDIPLFVLARDDAGYEPPANMNLAALRSAVCSIPVLPPEKRASGIKQRATDLYGRLSDQLLKPLREDRQRVDELIAALRGMETPVVGVDVNPLTRSLRRRLQQRSILYLMGPERVIDRVRQAPMLLARLPRSAWDYIKTGRFSLDAPTSASNGAGGVPDFRTTLAEQFAVLQSRIDDLLRNAPTAEEESPETGARPAAAKPYAAVCIPPEKASQIADEELADLTNWLQKKWNATPRDTRTLEGLLRFVPGAKALSRWSEAAPYLLALGLLVAHHVTAGTDLIVIGGYTVATWLTERLSNEVASRTRATNVRIESRFTELAHEQINRICQWLDHQAPQARLLDDLENEAGKWNKVLGLE